MPSSARAPNELSQDLFFFNSQIQKRAATGTLLTYRNNLDYEESNITSNQFFNTWNANIETEVRQPLLQNAGLDYNRIAGPSGVPGQPNGVLIARVNTDISLADFEVGVRDLVSNVENAYWDLYFAYRDLDAKVAARNTALESWRKVYSFYIARRKGGEAFREAEAREQYFRFQEEVQNSLTGRLVEGTQTNNGSSGGSFRATGGVHVAERRLRLLLGVPINDGQLLRPADEPSLARVVFDWNEVTAEALVRRTELRRQRWMIKRGELALLAARNYLKPQLDAVGLYRFRGFGDDLLPENEFPAEFDSTFDNLFSGDNQEWQLGLEFSMPFGFRRGHAAVRNAQIVLSRERAVLREQERDVMLGLSNAVAEVDRAWGVAQTAFNRRRAARNSSLPSMCFTIPTRPRSIWCSKLSAGSPSPKSATSPRSPSTPSPSRTCTSKKARFWITTRCFWPKARGPARPTTTRSTATAAAAPSGRSTTSFAADQTSPPARSNRTSKRRSHSRPPKSPAKRFRQEFQ